MIVISIIILCSFVAPFELDGEVVIHEYTSVTSAKILVYSCKYKMRTVDGGPRRVRGF